VNIDIVTKDKKTSMSSRPCAFVVVGGGRVRLVGDAHGCHPLVADRSSAQVGLDVGVPEECGHEVGTVVIRVDVKGEMERAE
jgi:hypothetical protein